MATFQYGGIMEQVAVVATSGTTDTLTNVSKQIRVYTGTVNQLIILPNATTFNEAGAKYELYNTSTGTLTVQANGGSQLATVSPNTSLVLKLSSNGTSAGTWVQQATSAASSGSKNYLSAYTASTGSGAANTGNGNFESGSTTGWSTFSTTITSGIPTGSIAAPLGSITLSTVSGSSAIAGLYSLSASYSPLTASDGFISSAFNIDLEDQAKMMQIKFYYTNHSIGTVNFSGTSANNLAIYIYDVTNSAWIQPAGVYNITQSSGVGYATATFQTTSNSTQYRLAILTINGSAQSGQIYFDDFTVGPQTAPSGPAMTDWIAYTPTITGFGTPTSVEFYYKREGDTLFVQGLFTSGTSTATGATVSIPSGLSIDTTKIPAALGTNLYTVVGNAGTSGTAGLLNMTYDAGNVGFSGPTGGNTIGFANGTTIASSGVSLGLNFKVPIAGWSSNTAMSSDTDTRVVAMQVQQASPTATVTSSFSLLKFTATPSADTHAGFSTSTGQYTVPVTGFYRCTASCQIAATFVLGNQTTIGIGHNSTTAPTYQSAQSAGGAVGDQDPTVTGTIYCLAGDTLNPLIASAGTSPTVNANTSANFFVVERLSGPAVVAATESVNASYDTAAGQSIPTNSATTVVFGSKNYDSHNAMNASTGVYTVPVSGKYQVMGGIYTSTSITATATDCQLQCIHNGGLNLATNNPKSGTTAAPLSVSGSFLLSCSAGDTISLSVLQTTGSAQTLLSSAPYNFFNILRVGN